MRLPPAALLAGFAVVLAADVGTAEPRTPTSRCGAPSEFGDTVFAHVRRVVLGNTAEDAEHREYSKLPQVDSASISLVTDETICDEVAKAALALTPAGTPDLGIQVIRVGPTRYVAVEWRIKARGYTLVPVFDSTYTLVGVIQH